jgi:hypothetical protein
MSLCGAQEETVTLDWIYLPEVHFEICVSCSSHHQAARHVLKYFVD